MTFASLEVDRQPEWVNAQIVSADYFEVLGVRPRLGRTFRRDEDRKPGGDDVLVISERLWRRRLGLVIGTVAPITPNGACSTAAVAQRSGRRGRASGIDLRQRRIPAQVDPAEAA